MGIFVHVGSANTDSCVCSMDTGGRTDLCFFEVERKREIRMCCLLQGSF